MRVTGSTQQQATSNQQRSPAKHVDTIYVALGAPCRGRVYMCIQYACAHVGGAWHRTISPMRRLIVTLRYRRSHTARNHLHQYHRYAASDLYYTRVACQPQLVFPRTTHTGIPAQRIELYRQIGIQASGHDRKHKLIRDRAKSREYKADGGRKDTSRKQKDQDVQRPSALSCRHTVIPSHCHAVALSCSCTIMPSQPHRGRLPVPALNRL